MKGGVVLALGVFRALAARPESFRRAGGAAGHRRGMAYPGLCSREAVRILRRLSVLRGRPSGPLAGDEAVVVRRKAAGTLRVGATGRASHSGSAPDQGRNALLALAETSIAIARHHDPTGEDELSVVPTVVRAGAAFNVVPADGELICDLRASRLEVFERVLAAVPKDVAGVILAAGMERRWPGMDTRRRYGLAAGASRCAARPQDRGCRSRWRERRQPLCGLDSADRRRTRTTGRWRSYA